MDDIVFKEVGKAYGEQQVLRGFSARFAAGKAVALMGPSGSGKTTITRLLLGLEEPDSGQITGREAVQFSAVFQEDRLCEGFSAVGNVALVLPKEQAKALQEPFKQLALAGELLAKPVSQLSGGERRRVALVRAVEAAGEFLLLDEPFNGMDDGTRALAIQYIKENRRGRSLLLVTHNSDEAAALEARVINLKAVASQPVAPT